MADGFLLPAPPSQNHSQCPYCRSDSGSRIVRAGSYSRKSDGAVVHRFRCRGCRRRFSEATNDPCFRQKKRQLNRFVFELYCSGISQRRFALIFRIHRRTVVRKILFLAAHADIRLREENRKHPLATEVEFDDLETIEHTKCKPLSVICMVEAKSRRILGMDVARMPAKGVLAKISGKKYGKRGDERGRVREKFLNEMKRLVSPTAIIKSDKCPSYSKGLKKHFPIANHKKFKGRRAWSTGHGEMKKGGFDPIFAINHTFAMTRGNINRLVRRTWATTKKPERLKAHLTLYAAYHNLFLLNHPAR